MSLSVSTLAQAKAERERPERHKLTGGARRGRFAPFATSTWSCSVPHQRCKKDLQFLKRCCTASEFACLLYITLSGLSRVWPRVLACLWCIGYITSCAQSPLCSLPRCTTLQEPAGGYNSRKCNHDGVCQDEVCFCAGGKLESLHRDHRLSNLDTTETEQASHWPANHSVGHMSPLAPHCLSPLRNSVPLTTSLVTSS